MNAEAQDVNAKSTAATIFFGQTEQLTKPWDSSGYLFDTTQYQAT
jgi:hypothetical protein